MAWTSARSLLLHLSVRYMLETLCSLTRQALAILCLSTISGCGSGGSNDNPNDAWAPPRCSSIVGSNVIAFTTDEGMSLASPPMPNVPYSVVGRSIVALDAAPQRMLASFDAFGSATAPAPAVLRSNDAGCTWVVATQTGGETTLVGGDGEITVGWVNVPGSSGSRFISLDRRGDLLLTTDFSEGTAGLAADRADAGIVRRVARDGRITQSLNGGRAWTQIAQVPSSAVPVFNAYFGGDLDRVAVPGSRGLFTTSNGGVNWTESSFDTNAANRIVIFAVAYNANGTAIWAHGRDLDEAANDPVSDGRHLWRSIDGGATFSSVLTQDGQTQFVSSLFPHPADPDIVYWFGARTSDPFVALFKYSNASGTSTRRDLTGITNAVTIEFSPAHPGIMYFGLHWPN